MPKGAPLKGCRTGGQILESDFCFYSSVGSSFALGGFRVGKENLSSTGLAEISPLLFVLKEMPILREFHLCGMRQQLATFLADFLFEFLGKLTGKIANSNHMIASRLATGHK